MQFIVADEVFEFVAISPGEFEMGSGNQLFSEAPRHHVRIADGFLYGKYPVTQRQWQAITGMNPSQFHGLSDRPADTVDWVQATGFCVRLSEMSGRHCRLPSEAEWEYACRAGSQGEFFFGTWGPFTDGGAIPFDIRRVASDYAWFDLNSNESTHPVGLKRPNPWGLHDMIGNVWEWCSDVWHGTYLDAPTDGSSRGDDAFSQPRRCQRGGAWDMDAFRLRSTYRSWDHLELATNRSGLRIVMEL